MYNVVKKNSKNSLEIAIFIILILLLLLPNIILYFSTEGAFLDKTEPFFISLIVVLVILAFLRKLWVFLLVLSPMFMLMPLESYYAYMYGSFTNAHIMGVVADSNFFEIKSYFDGILHLVIFSYVFLIILLNFGIFICYKKKIILKKFYTILIIFTLTPVLIYKLSIQHVSFLDYGVVPDTQPLFNRNYLPDGFYYFDKTFPVGFMIRVYEFFQEQEKLKKYVKLTSDFKFKIEKKTQLKQTITNKTKEVYVLVIGESSRYDHWGVNGYDRNTSPLLMQRQDIISYKNFYTVHGNSRQSIPVILTRKTAIDKGAGFHEKSIISVFNQIDFKTYWLSMQMTFGPYDTPISMFAKEAQTLEYFNNATFYENGGYDEKLFPAFEKTLEQTDKNNLFIVLHTLGSHSKYHHRYPSQFAKFNPSRKLNSNPSNKKSLLIKNDYDNSILYTDYILHTLITQLEKKNYISWLIYVSDHGVELLEDGKRSGQGFNSNNVLHIPLFFWFSDKYKQAYPDRVHTILDKTEEHLTTEILFSTFTNLAGVKVEK